MEGDFANGSLLGGSSGSNFTMAAECKGFAIDGDLPLLISRVRRGLLVILTRG